MNLKVVKRFIFLPIVLMLLSFPLRGYSQSTQGKDFLISFGLIFTGSPVSMIKIVASDPTNVTFTYNSLTGAGSTYTRFIPAGTIYSYTFSATERNAIIAGTTASNNSLRLQSDNPISVYIFNASSNQGDATLVLPINAWGMDYYHLSYTPGNRPDSYVVIAVENGTTVFRDGGSSVNLNAGQSIRYEFPGATNNTGTHISSNKPIAYFVSNENPNTGSANMMFEQLPPTDLWGNSFMVPVLSVSYSTVRVVASQNGTNVSCRYGSNLSSTYTLNAGQYVDLGPNTTTGCWIETDNPVLVGTYLSTAALTWVPPVRQAISPVYVAPFSGGNPNSHYAIIVAPTQDRTQTTVAIGTGMYTPLSGGSWVTCVNNDYSYYVMPLTNTTSSYMFSHPTGILAWIYGTGSNASYFYVGASATRPQVVSFSVNNISYLDLPSTVFTTTNNMNFFAGITEPLNTNPGHLKWYIDNVEETAAQDLIAWNKNLPNGIYQIKMVYTLSNNTVDSLKAVLKIAVPLQHHVCEGKSITLSANIYNGGSSPSYQWKKNNVDILGATASTYTCVPAHGDIFTCEITSNANCAEPTTALSQSITILLKGPATITTPTPPSAICAGSTMTLTVPAINLGSSTLTAPGSWTLNGVYFNPSTPLSYTQNGQALAYKIETECGTFSSGTVAVTVNDKPSFINNIAPVLSNCSGWYMNTAAPMISDNGSTLTNEGWIFGGAPITLPYLLSDTDNNKVLYYSASNVCGTTTSNTVTITVTPNVVPTISVTASDNNVCSGTSITYTANITNGGTSPGYQWQINGVPVGGATGSTYAYQPANGDVITCVLTSNAACANPVTVTSTPGVTMTVIPTVVPSLTISGVPD